jgi:hypothetical protein
MGGRAPAALPWARDALELAIASGNDEARLAAIGGFTIASVFTGRSDVRELFEEAIELSAATESWSMLATAAAFGGASLAHLDPELGEALVRQGEDAARRSGNPYDVGTVAMAHGRLLGRSGRTDGAIEQFNIAISRFAEVGDSRIGLAVRSDLAHALRHGGRLDEAEAMYRETIVAWSHIGHRGAVANRIESFAFLALDRGQPERAARLLGAAEAIREVAGAPMAFDEEPVMTRAVERLRTMAPADEIEAAWQAGRTLAYADAVTLALET